MSNKLNGKTVVITGASSGIGAAMAREYAAMGAKVVLGARQADKLSEMCREIESKGGKAAWSECDVTKAEDCQRLIQTAVEKFGGIDVLICNAGISMRALFDDLDLSVLHRLMDVNFWGTIFCTKYALPYLLKSKGSVVGVISTAGYAGLPGRTGYSTSKFAIRGFLETLRMEHQDDGLHVLVFAPGYTASNVRNAALLADGREQGCTPKDESKLMSAEEVALKMAKGLFRHKREMILTMLGYWDVWFYKRIPGIMDQVQLRYIRKHEKSIDPEK